MQTKENMDDLNNRAKKCNLTLRTKNYSNCISHTCEPLMNAQPVISYIFFLLILAFPARGDCGTQIYTKWATCVKTSCPPDSLSLQVNGKTCPPDHVCCLMRPKINFKVTFRSIFFAIRSLSFSLDWKYRNVLKQT